MKNKLLFGIALCLGLCSMASAQFGPGRNNEQTTEDPAANPRDDAGEEATEPGTRPGGNGGRQTANTISIRFMTPWTNSSAIMHAGNATDSMKLVKNYCGWFESKVPAPGEGQSAQIYFTQTLGGTAYGAEGINNSDPISLDSILATGATTVWIKPVPYPNGTPTLYSDFPTGSLGVCTKKLPVMVFDWYHGDKGDGGVSTRTNRDSTTTITYGNGAKDQDPTLGPLYATSNDFGSGGCGRRTAGMVEPVLGPNGVPVRAAVFPESCQLTEHINNWFLPQVVAHDAAGKEYTNATCREIELEMDENGMWLGQRDKNSPAGGLFLLDDFQFLDPAETVKNPFYDNLSGQGARGGRHNFGFTMKIQAQFEYVPGQYFSFFGDDDVWVFINNRLVVDIGGQHAQEEGAVDLDTLGLTPGVTYPFHIFYAERHIYESNFKMLTSIDLQTEASLLLNNLSTDERNLNYEIWQIVREEQLSCDFSNTMQDKDTSRAASNFNLSGGNLPAEGVYLDSAGTWYGGIIINKDMSGFKVNVDAIKEARALSPGQYCMRFTLQSDPTQGDEVWFEVDAYALPTVVFADSKWKILGGNLNSQVTPLGEWAYQKYQVNVQYEEEWGAEYNDVLYINSTDSLMTVVDSAGNPISSVTLNAGKATFYIIGKGEVVNATLMVRGAATSNTAAWTNINLKLPPVPLVEYAIMYDRDGDGRADSLFVKYTKELTGKSKIDSLQFTFGEQFPVLTKYIMHDSTLILTAEGGFGNTVFTGSSDTLYNGMIETWFTFSDNGGKSVFPITGDIIDRVNPIITSAEVEITDHNTNLVITFSEGIADSSKDYFQRLFLYKCWRVGVLKDPITPMSVRRVKPNIWKMPFNGGLNDVVPAVGDSIRLVPGDAPLYVTGTEVAFDLSGTSPHKQNPWVRITGDQEVQLSSAPVAGVNGDNEKTVAIVTSKEATVPTLITDMTKDVKEIVDEYGVQGHLIGFDMAQLAANENAAVVADIDKGKLTVDILRQIESGQMSVKEAKKEYGLSESTVNAIKEGALTSSNFAGVKNGTVKVMSKDNITLHYKTSYFSSLGHYVNGESGSIACADTIYNGDCLSNGGNLFLAWNMRATDGRLVATGVYIARIEITVKAGSKTISEMTRDMLWGVRRGKINALDLNIK